MAQDNLTSHTVAQLARLIESKEVSPVEVADAFLRHIEAMEPKLNAFITRLDDHARRAAAAAEAEIMAREHRGPFHGIPVGLKDIFWTRDIRTTSGSILDADFIPSEDAEVVSRLTAAGAYYIGKLHMTEFAFDGTSRNHHYGPARNPWDTERMAGGSSSGSGVAVASGEAPIALGTDTGGSVRVPAALCGVTGFKPTYGLISRSGVTPLSWSMDHVGPLARTAEDAALAMNVLVGHDQRDRASIDAPTLDYTRYLNRGVDGMRIGVPREYVWEMVESEVRNAFDHAMKVLEGQGATMEEVSIPDLHLINPAGSIVQTSEAATIHRPRLLARGDRYDPVIRRRFESGLFITAEAYLTAQRVRARCRQHIIDTLDRVDLLAVPTTSIAAPLIEQERITVNGQEVSTREAVLRITRIFSAAGLPAISVPCGFTEARLPIGLQLVGKPLEDTRVLQAAHAYQAATSWHLERPNL